MTFHCVADIAYFWPAVTEIIQFFHSIPNVTSGTCSKTWLKTGQIQDWEHFEILGYKRSLIKAMHHLVFYWNWLVDSIEFDHWQKWLSKLVKCKQVRRKEISGFCRFFAVLPWIIAWLKFLCGQSIRFPASFLCLSFPVPFLYIARTKTVLTGLKAY